MFIGLCGGFEFAHDVSPFAGFSMGQKTLVSKGLEINEIDKQPKKTKYLIYLIDNGRVR